MFEFARSFTFVRLNFSLIPVQEGCNHDRMNWAARNIDTYFWA